jgi:hypothetical protein
MRCDEDSKPTFKTLCLPHLQATQCAVKQYILYLHGTERYKNKNNENKNENKLIKP